MSLHDIHQQFITAMYQSSVAAEKFIKPSTILSANERLAIYRGSVRGGLLQALENIYPVLKQLLGDHAFEGLSRRYIEQHRSSSANIADYGDNFPEFIRFFKPNNLDLNLNFSSQSFLDLQKKTSTQPIARLNHPVL